MNLARILAFCLLVPSAMAEPIDLSSDLALQKTILAGVEPAAVAAVQTVLPSLDAHNPILVCVVGQYQFAHGKKEAGFRLYQLGRLRVLFDIRRCTDRTVADTAQVLDQSFYPAFSDWVDADKERYIRINLEAVDAFEKGTETYDQRWINLRGMGAMSQSLGGKPVNTAPSVPESEWADIKAKLVAGQRDYFQNYEENYFIDRFGRTSSTYFSGAQKDLARAAAKGDIPGIEAALRVGADVNVPGLNGVTPVVWALGAQNLAGVEALLNRGAKPNVPFEKAQSTLGLAVYLKNVDIVALLLEAGARIGENKGDEGTTLIQDVLLGASPDFTMLRLLVKHGASVVGRAGFEGSYLSKYVSYRQFDTVLVLLELGAGALISERSRTAIETSFASLRADQKTADAVACSIRFKALGLNVEALQ